MKTIHGLLVVAMLCGLLAAAGCQNTANGFHQDWRSNMQSMANETNK